MRSMPPLAAGDALALTRKVSRVPDPTRLFAALTDEGRRPDIALLETADVSSTSSERSLLVTQAALRIVGRGRVVRVDALTANGSALLPWLAKHLLPVAKVDYNKERLSCFFSPIPPGHDEQRLRAASPTDVPRLLLRALKDTVGQKGLTEPLLVGTLAYDLLECYEPLPESKADPLNWPDMELWLPERAIWVDGRREMATIVAWVFGGEGVEARYGDAMHDIGVLVSAAEKTPLRPPVAAQVASCKEDAGRRLEVAVDLDDEAYASLVAKLKANIIAGDVFQIVPSRTFSCGCTDPYRAYQRLRKLNPSPYMFFLRASQGVLLGASPETAVKVDGQPLTLHVRPLAGTRPRGRTEAGAIDADLDSRLEAELRLNTKEVAEHMMLVDLARNDVARVCRAGTRCVRELLEVVRYSHVMHLSSHVLGELREGLDALHAYVATMNMGTLVGAPKIRAAQLLREVEATRRGPYGGAVGYLSGSGVMDTAIVIRSAVVSEGRAYVRAGAGVVYDSDPQAEADETRRKAEAMLAALADEPGAAVG